MKRNFITVIEFTDKFIKVLRVESRERLTLAFLAAREVLDKSDEDLAKDLTAMLSACNNRPNSLLVVIPRRLAVLKRLSLPSQKDEELRKMVELGVDQYVPYGKTDVLSDYILLEKEASGHSKILATFIQKDILRRYLKILKLARQNPHQITLSSYGLAGFAHGNGENSVYSAVIHLESSRSEICFCREEQLLFSRSIQFGWDDLIGENSTDFMREIAQTLHIYDKEKMGGELSKISILSGGQDLSSFQSQLISLLKLPIEVLSVERKLILKKDGGWRTMEPDRLPVAGLGLILSKINQTPNLFPEEFKESLGRRRRTNGLMWCGFLIVILTLMNTLTFGLELYKESKIYHGLRQTMNEIEPKAIILEKKMKQIRIVKEKIMRRLYIVDLFTELYRYAPPELSFDHLNIDQDEFVIEGIAKLGTYLNSFQNNLVGSSSLQNVVLQYATRRKISGEDATFYKITGQVLK